VNQQTNKRYDFFSQGIFVDPMVSNERLRNLAQKIRSVKTGIELIRVGADEDGGYLIPNDLFGIEACFSPGVDQIASFEAGLLAFGIQSHLADFSVDDVPEGVEVATFIKKFIGANSEDHFISLKDWIDGTPNIKNSADLILQMDIEGAEYEALLSTPEEVLSRFRIMAIEFHNIETWSQRDYLSIVEATFNKLLRQFYVVHNHPNNAMGIVDLNGFKAPRLFEITFIRKDRVQQVDGYATLPHALDRPNLSDRPDILFPEGWV